MNMDITRSFTKRPIRRRDIGKLEFSTTLRRIDEKNGFFGFPNLKQARTKKDFVISERLPKPLCYQENAYGDLRKEKAN